MTSIQAALVLAQALTHPLSLTMALRWAAVLHHLRREASLTQIHAEAAISLATDQGFPPQVALVMPLRGWALAMNGQGEEGRAQIYQGLAAHRRVMLLLISDGAPAQWTAARWATRTPGPDTHIDARGRGRRGGRPEAGILRPVCSACGR